MNICNYTPLRFISEKDINERFKLLFDNVFYLLSRGTSGGGGGNPLTRVDFSVNANPNTGGTTFSPNTPQQSNVLYVSTIDNSLWIWNGSIYVTYVAPFWTISGNNVNTNDFIGSTNNASLKFRTNNTQRLVVDGSGNVGINTSSPVEKLDVSGNIKFSGALMPNSLSGTSGQLLLSSGTGAPPTWGGITFSTVGSSPVAGGASSSGSTVTLQPASASYGGVVSITDQTFEGIKTFNKDVIINGHNIGRGPGNNISNFRLGSAAFNSNISGTDCIAIGQNSSSSSTTSYQVTSIGSFSASTLSTGNRITSIGAYSLVRLTTGSNVIGVGLGAGASNTTGSNNIYLENNNPISSGNGITTGSGNLIIGGFLGGFASNLTNNIIIANGVGSIRFKDDDTNTILPRLAGTGTRMVVAGTNGELSTQTIPSSTTINFADEETPSGTIDGTNLTFTLANTPISGSVKLYLRGLRLKRGDDYTISGTTITMIIAPLTGDNLLADYRY